MASKSNPVGCLVLLGALMVMGSCNAMSRNNAPVVAPAQPIIRHTPTVPPKPIPVQEDPTEVPEEEPLQDVDVDVHHDDDHNRRDGSNTFGYCARKWWC